MRKETAYAFRQMVFYMTKMNKEEAIELLKIYDWNDFLKERITDLINGKPKIKHYKGWIA